VTFSAAEKFGKVGSGRNFIFPGIHQKNLPEHLVFFLKFLFCFLQEKVYLCNRFETSPVCRVGLKIVRVVEKRQMFLLIRKNYAYYQPACA
jgi:hypothetical protein